MGRIRRSFDIGFKIQVCEAIDAGEKTVLEICRQYQLQRPVVEGWLRKFVRGELKPKGIESLESQQAREIEKLRAKVGELTMQNDLLKKLSKVLQELPKKNERSSIYAGGNLEVKDGHAKPVIYLPAPTITGKKTKR
jgi:transposase-like protein